jgi:hypothetical protein
MFSNLLLKKAEVGIKNLLGNVPLEPGEVKSAIVITEIDGDTILRIMTLKEVEVDGVPTIAISRYIQGVSLTDVL